MLSSNTIVAEVDQEFIIIKKQQQRKTKNKQNKTKTYTIGWLGAFSIFPTNNWVTTDSPAVFKLLLFIRLLSATQFFFS